MNSKGDRRKSLCPFLLLSDNQDVRNSADMNEINAQCG